MNRSILVSGALGILILVLGVSIRNPYLLVAGVVLIAFAIIQFTRYINEQIPDREEDIPDLKNAKITNVSVADLSHHMDAFMAAAIPNPDYRLGKEEIEEKGLSDTMIYEYNFPYQAVLKRAIPNDYNQEPVDVLLNGEVVGSIPLKKSAYIYVLVGMKGIRYMETEITGGRYKIVRNGALETGKKEYRIALTIYGDA